VTQLLGYIEQESGRIRELRAGKAAPEGHGNHEHHDHGEPAEGSGDR
jgi:hypothetical protein